jgi:hypothetical protein
MKWKVLSGISLAIILITCSLDSGGDSGGGKVGTPVIFPEGGQYSVWQSITIYCETEGATIYYTTDGQNPTRSSNVYDPNTSTILMGTGTVKAFAVKEGYEDSDIASETYIITVGTIPTNVSWTRFLGGTGSDHGNDLAIDNEGNLYVTGKTQNSLGGQANKGGYDVFLAKYNPQGRLQWIRMRGGQKDDSGEALAFDSDGNIYITGYAKGSFDDLPVREKGALILIKYTPTGVHKWTRVLNPTDANWSYDNVVEGYSIAIDSSNRIIVGGTGSGYNAGTNGYFIVVYNQDGEFFGSATEGSWGTYEGIRGIALSNTGLYAVGYSDRKLVLQRYSLPNYQLLKQVSIDNSYGSGIAVDSSNNVYVIGYTNAPLDGQQLKGGNDICLIKYDSTLENRLWTRLIGGTSDDFGTKITLDASGNCYIVGKTLSSFHNQQNHGGIDAVLMKYDTNGNHQWTTFLGGENGDGAYGVKLDSNGNVLIAGATKSSFNGNTLKGENDVFLHKYIP